MTLRRQIVDFVGLDLLDQANEIGRIGEVTIVREKTDIRLVRINIEIINPRRIER